MHGGERAHRFPRGVVRLGRRAAHPPSRLGLATTPDHREQLLPPDDACCALIDQLEDEGVKSFAKSYDDLLAALETRRREMVAQRGAGGRGILVVGGRRGAASPGVALRGYDDALARVGRECAHVDRRRGVGDPALAQAVSGNGSTMSAHAFRRCVSALGSLGGEALF